MYRRGDVARALRLLDALRGYKHGRTLGDLAAKLGVSERTVRRDLQELADADVRVELSRVDGCAAARLLEASYRGVPVTRRERTRCSPHAACSTFCAVRRSTKT